MFKQDNLIKFDKRRISCLKTDGGVEFVPVIEVPSNMYENENAPKRIGFSVNTTEAKLLIKANLCFTDETSIELDDIEAANGETVYAYLPDMSDIYGVFYLELTAFDGNGEYAGEQTIPFSHLRTGRGHFKKAGTGLHLIYHDIPDTYQCFEHLLRCGITVVRDDLLWCNMETEKGVIEVKENYCHTVDTLVEKGFEPHLLLLYGNNFYDEGMPPKTEEGLAAYVRFCEEMVSHFKGKIMHYEIWNEYNLGMGRAIGDPEQYAWMLKAAYKAIKAIDPEITVSAAVTSGTQPEWIRRMIAAGAYDYFDEITIHPYCGWPDYAYPDENQGQAERNVQCYKDVIAEFGKTKPVWISEMGWTSGALMGGIDREGQAECIARLFAIAESSDIAQRIIFYDFRDDGIDPFNMEHHWGLVEAMGSVVPNAAKESYAAVSCLNYMIGNAQFVSKCVTADIKNTVFEENGKRINILWSLDGAKSVTVKVSKDAKVYDIYGNLSEIGAGEQVMELDGSITYIVGAEVTVLESRKPEKLVYDFPYTLSAVPEKREDGWYIKALVHNHSRTLKGRIRIELPELEISGNYESFALSEGESFEVAAFVGETDYKKLYRALVDINLTSGERNIKSELVSFLEIPYGEEKAVINLSAKEKYVRIGGAECPELGAEIKMSYDEEKLYLDATVLDKTHLQLGTTGDTWMDIWDGDGLELILQPLYDGNKEITRYSHIGLALTSNKHEKIAWRWRTVSNRGNGRMYDCEFDAVRESDRTVYKAALDWKDILPPNVELSDCDSFGFSVRVNYAESNPRSIDGYIQLYSGIGSWRKPHSYQPSEFGRFVLKKK